MKTYPAFRFWAPAMLLGAVSLAPLAASSAVAQTPQAASQTPQAASQTPALLDKAHTLEVRGRMDMASQIWQQILLADPNNTEALGGLARAAKLSGNNDVANTYLGRLRAINPNDPGIARVEHLGTQADPNVQLQQAGKLAQQGQYGQAMQIYRQVYGNTPPPGDASLAFYETEAATEDGRPQAVAGLEGLVKKYPADSRYQVALGRILTYNPRTRPEGRRLLAAHPSDPEAVEALRQSLLWDAANPATGNDIRAYLARHPDATLATALRAQPRVTGPSRPAVPQTPEQRAAAAALASRNAESNAAYRELNAKHLPAAEAKFKAILAKNAEDPNALAGMGYIRMQQANFGGALSFLTQAKQDGSKDPGLDSALATSRFYYTLGEGAIALNENDLPTAEKQYRAALGMRPASPEALEGLGGTLLKAQQPEAAVPYFAQFVKVQPLASHAWRGLFLAQYGAGNSVQALLTERQFPAPVRAELMKDPLYLRALSSAYSSVGRDADAQRVLKTALDLPFPADAKGLQADTQLQYAGLLQAASRLDQAAGLYRQVLAKDQNNTSAWQGLVRVEHTMNNDSEALQTLESMPPASYAQAMREPGFEATVASVYQAQKRLDVAQEVLEKAVAQQTTAGQKPSVAVEVQLAGIYLQRNEPQQAYPLYQSVLSQYPDRIEAWKGLLSALHATGRDNEVLAEVQQIPSAVRARLESDPEYLQTIGSTYAALGQAGEAQVFVRRVQQHYAAENAQAPADVDIQNGWLLYNGMNDQGLYRQLLALGGRTDLTDEQRRTVQTIWANWAVRRANQAAAAGDDKRALAILNATAAAFPDNPGVVKALAGGYARAGMPREAVSIWKSEDLKTAPVTDYRAAVGSALAASDTKDAETWLRFGLDQYPHDPDLLILAAKFEEQRGDTNRAAEYYRASLKAMPAADPGAALMTEMGRPLPATSSTALPTGRSAADLATLLAPGRDDASPAAQPSITPAPYLPSYGPGANAPVPVNNGYPAGGNVVPSYMTDPAARPAAPPSGTRLRDYVPQASLQDLLPPEATTPHPLVPETSVPVAEQVAAFQQQQVLRLTQRVLLHDARFALRLLPLDSTPAASMQTQPSSTAGWHVREAAYVIHGNRPSVSPFVQQAAQQQSAKPGAQGTASTPAPAADPSQAVTFGAYVPYRAPAAAQSTGAQSSQAVEIRKPGPLTAQPASAYSSQTPAQQAAQQQGTAPARPAPAGQAVPQQSQSTAPADVYGPYVPYHPPAATSVQLGNTPAVRPMTQPEVTDVLPTAKYVPNATSRPPVSSNPDAAAARAAEIRKRQSIPVRSGVSHPPEEDYSTAPTQSVQYSPAQQGSQVTQPNGNAQTTLQNTQSGMSTSAPQGGTGNSSGQQYPQPNTGPYRESRPVVTHNRRPSRGTRPAAAPAAVAAQPAPAPQPVYQGLSYPGIGQPLTYQPYPQIGPAYPLGTAPTDADLIEKRVPPLRGGYDAATLPPQVPLTPRQQTERDLAALEGSYSPWLGGTASARYRSGTQGLDRLTDLEATFEASATVGNHIRFTIVPRTVFLNSGQLDLTTYAGLTTGVPVLGTLPLNAVNEPPQQSTSGVGGEFQVAGSRFAAAVGYTPYEFLVRNITGRGVFIPNRHVQLYFNRDSVVETQLSYAGLRDPGSATAVYGGNIWGGVVSTGGGARFEMGDEKAGFYFTADGADLSGYHVLENSKFEGSAGAYFLAHTFPGYGRLNIGASAFGMHYAHNERGLSYGLGGYFSPDAYFLASVPVTFIGRYGNNFHYTVAGSVGVQTFQEDSQIFFPLDRALQTSFAATANGGLPCTTAQLANHTCASNPNNTSTGGNYSINSEGSYRISDHWFAGGFLSANNTNNYNTVTAGFFVRYLFRPQYGTDDTPTGLFPVDGFRPLRVP